MTLARLAAKTLRKDPRKQVSARRFRREGAGLPQPGPARNRPTQNGPAQTGLAGGALRLAVALLVTAPLVMGLASPVASWSSAQPGSELDRSAGTSPGALGGLVRLHVVGHSDRPEDQALKLAVRDAILARHGEELAALADEGALAAWIAARGGSLERVANQVLAEGGATYRARLVLGWYEFPESRFGPLVFPAGRYQTLRLTLGDGAGQNWWCVLFPPLCLVDERQVTEVELRPADVAVPALNPLAPGSSPETNRGTVEWRWSFLEQEDGTPFQPPLYLARWWSEARRLVQSGTARFLGEPARAGAPDDGSSLPETDQSE